MPHGVWRREPWRRREVDRRKAGAVLPLTSTGLMAPRSCSTSVRLALFQRLASRSRSCDVSGPSPDPVSRHVGRTVGTALGVLLAGCGGSSPSSPPIPTPEPGFTVVAVVYYDENGNGALDSQERVRVPDVEVMAGGRSARSQTGTGQAVIANVPAGAQTASVKPETLPPFYAAGPPATIEVPLGEGSRVWLPLTLPIGNDSLPNVTMAFGDSLTRGDGSSDGRGYPARLESRLLAHFGDALVINRGADATNSYEAIERLQRNLAGSQPAYTLILYGTNDWNIPGCQDNAVDCPTVENLRTVVRGVKAFGSLPFLATIPPANPTLNPPSRNEWAKAMSGLIKTMAQEEGAFLVDLYEAFAKQGDLTRLFSDHVHPNDAGYQVMAEAFFEAIAHGRSVPP